MNYFAQRLRVVGTYLINPPQYLQRPGYHCFSLGLSACPNGSGCREARRPEPSLYALHTTHMRSHRGFRPCLSNTDVDGRFSSWNPASTKLVYLKLFGDQFWAV